MEFITSINKSESEQDYQNIKNNTMRGLKEHYSTEVKNGRSPLVEFSTICKWSGAFHDSDQIFRYLKRLKGENYIDINHRKEISLTRNGIHYININIRGYTI
jgi:hypothetical protein